MANNLENLQSEIRHQLRILGYHNIKMVNKTDLGFDLIADGALRNIFLSVVVILADHLSKLTEQQIRDIKQKAISMDKEPWSALMSVDERGELVENIKWINLAKATA